MKCIVLIDYQTDRRVVCQLEQVMNGVGIYRMTGGAYQETKDAVNHANFMMGEKTETAPPPPPKTPAPEQNPS